MESFCSVWIRKWVKKSSKEVGSLFDTYLCMKVKQLYIYKSSNLSMFKAAHRGPVKVMVMVKVLVMVKVIVMVEVIVMLKI